VNGISGFVNIPRRFIGPNACPVVR